MLDFYSGKVVLVTGHTGFKGSWLTKVLTMAGAKVIGYSVDIPTNPSLFDLLEIKNEIVDIRADIRDFNSLLSVIKKYKPEIVFHLAAQPLVLESYKEPRHTYDVNVMGTVNLLEALRITNCAKSIVNVTTDKVYKNSDDLNRPFSENDELNGYDPYSNSKSCSELVTSSYITSFFNSMNISVSTVRAGNVIGGGDFSDNRIIPDCVRAAISGNLITVRNRLSTRPYQFVLEPIFAYLLIAEQQYHNRNFSGSYNIGPDLENVYETGKLVQEFCDAWGGVKWVDATATNSPHEAKFLSLNNTKIKETFSWHPVYNVNKTLKYIVEFHKGLLESKSIIDIAERQIKTFVEDYRL